MATVQATGDENADPHAGHATRTTAEHRSVDRALTPSNTNDAGKTPAAAITLVSCGEGAPLGTK